MQFSESMNYSTGSISRRTGTFAPPGDGREPAADIAHAGSRNERSVRQTKDS